MTRHIPLSIEGAEGPGDHRESYLGIVRSFFRAQVLSVAQCPYHPLLAAIAASCDVMDLLKLAVGYRKASYLNLP